MGPRTQPGSRYDTIDACKGLAILAVIAIHAEILRGSILHLHLVNRAVPVLFVLFGITSELWWKNRASSPDDGSPVRAWYRKRLGHLLPGAWAVMLVWWTARALLADIPSDGLWAGLLGATIGYAPAYGTGWFVVVLVELILLFPLLRYAVEKFGCAVAAVAAAGCSALAIFNALHVAEWGQALSLGSPQTTDPFYHYYIFAPRVVWPVTLGIVLARISHRSKPLVVWLSGALVVAGPLLASVLERTIDNTITRPLYEMLLMAALDGPLAIALLGTCAALQLPGKMRRFLLWCGGASWGLYLGHSLVFEIVHLAGFAPEKASEGWVRALYGMTLLGAGAAVTQLARRLRRGRKKAATLSSIPGSLVSEASPRTGEAR